MTKSKPMMVFYTESCNIKIKKGNLSKLYNIKISYHMVGNFHGIQIFVDFVVSSCPRKFTPQKYTPTKLY